MVDDRSENLRLRFNLLKQHGHSVRAAASGSLAIAAAESSPPDVILVDINLLGIDGYDTCSQTKLRRALDDVPVIIVSGSGAVIDKVRTSESAGGDPVRKPVEIEEIETRIMTHAFLRRLRLDATHRYEELRKLEEMRDRVNQMIPLESRSPLSAVSGCIDDAGNCFGPLRDATAAELLDNAHLQATHLMRMIDDR